ncbi:Hypothetical predicted protein [Mytilus galloprovincialis]|uniref:Uncharacterized protein n=1 Tax=Mytilus galloprovincialis TaxID=29158 RepID=A0A8B6D9P5_MYTGA|nr:Hypothetical predicted protein [Mytilus galloprovincialis]
MMKSFLILLCLLTQLTVINKNTTSRLKVQPYNVVTAHDLQKDGTTKIGLNLLEVILLFLCFVVSFVVFERYRFNNNLTKQVQLLRRNSVNHDLLISRLFPFLEDSRSRNSGIEMPLRKLNRNIDYLVSDIESHNSELEKIHTKFTSFKVEWLEQSKKYTNISESVLVSSIEAPQISSELDSLREYIGDFTQIMIL